MTWQLIAIRYNCAVELLAHLDALVAVVDAQSFTRAADRLGIPQPVVSRRVHNLERVWGQPLLDRTARASTPTPFAQAVLPHARELLLRAERLERAVSSARKGVIRTLGVPPDCPAPALARLLQAAAEHGLTLAIRELPARSRQEALESGELALALTRVTVERASLRVPLGLAAAPSRPGPSGGAWHLDVLRPRRGSSTPSPQLLVLPEDDVEPFLDRLRDEVARAGMSPAGIRVDPPGTAAAQVLAAGAVLFCDRGTAERLGLGWAPLASRTLDRGYELTAPASLSEWMVPLLRAAVGGVPSDYAEPPESEPVDPALRFAASG
ncbi:MAG: LysR family transcriptional regulator [Solirubrobacterales bacterium]|nr:LysR family transcriptional regulator [Solirubrobacterales bacterium]